MDAEKVGVGPLLAVATDALPVAETDTVPLPLALAESVLDLEAVGELAADLDTE